MKREDYLKEFKSLCDEELETTKFKNDRYARSEDAFANFREIEIASHGVITAEMGIFIRLTDKFSRISNLLFTGMSGGDESLEDTLKDIAVYCKIWRILRRIRLNELSLKKENPLIVQVEEIQEVLTRKKKNV